MRVGRSRDRNRRTAAVAVAGALLIAVAGASSAQEGPEGTGVPDAASVLDRHVEASGGAEAFAGVEARRTEGTMEIVAQGLVFELTLWEKRPDLVYSRLHSDAIGTMEGGATGDVAWESSVMTGPRIKRGDERRDALLAARMDRYIRWRDHFAEVTFVDRRERHGVVCDVVRAVPAEGGAAQLLFFDSETGLLDAIETTVHTSAGEIPVATRQTDYRDVGGMLLPYRIEVEALGSTRVLSVRTIENNPDVPAGLFELPDEVSALLSDDGQPADDLD